MDESSFPTWRPSRTLVALVGLLFISLVLRDPPTAVQVLGTIALGMGVLTLIVIVHELGHALMARAVGVRVLEFGIFFPPRVGIVGHVRGVPVSINWLPLGGFTRLAGEREADGPDTFKGTTLPRRLAIILAGPAANIVLAYVLLLLVMATSSTHGITEAPGRAWALLVESTVSTLTGLAALPGAIFSDPSNPPVVGIPGLVALTGMAAEFGLRQLVALAALVSVSIGILNAVPLPPLDGGQALLAIMERFGGVRSPQAVTRFTMVGLAFIIGLAVLANGADLARLVSGGSLTGQ